eukprot:6771896-Prorocentrum_lima.AAC.1
MRSHRQVPQRRLATPSGAPVHFCPAGHCPSSEHIVAIVCSTVVRGLSPAVLPLWPRHRWTGAEDAADW